MIENILLLASIVFNLVMYLYISIKIVNNKYKKSFMFLFLLLMLWCLGLFVQKMLINYIEPFCLDCIVYISICIIPVIFFNISYIYERGNLPKYFKYFYIVPILSLLVLWTNNLHHWFYIDYSTNIAEAKLGWYISIHTIYTYTLLIVAMLKLVRTSLMKSGFFSVQTALMIIGCLFPLVPNILGTLKLIPINIYVTPIMFLFTSLSFYIAIFRYKALNMIPISFRTIIDTMSDSYIAISDDGTVVDKNKTFDIMFDSIIKFEKEDNFFEMIEKSGIFDLDRLKRFIKNGRNENDVKKMEINVNKNDIEKYFHVDIHSIKAVRGSAFVGTLLLFKDITQHKHDIATIEAKQEVIVKQGQLVSIGELAGSVAHDINTPISAIKTGIGMLTEDSESKTDVEKELLSRMDNCADKIIKIVNSMRNQIRNLGTNEKINFKVSEILEDIRIITYNEAHTNNCEVIVDIKDDLEVKGVPTKLGQVFTNLIINAIQAYDEKGGRVEIIISKAPENKVLIMVRDYAGGMPEEIKKSAFKEILTTKGSKGTGLGLYLAYSVIKGEFGGDITLETVDGEGTIFYIVLDKAVEEETNKDKNKDK